MGFLGASWPTAEATSPFLRNLETLHNKQRDHDSVPLHLRKGLGAKPGSLDKGKEKDGPSFDVSATRISLAPRTTRSGQLRGVLASLMREDMTDAV